MTQFEVYSLILCIIVFILLVSVFTFLLYNIVMLWFKHVRAGLYDEEIIREFEENKNKKENKAMKFVNSVCNVFLGVIFFLLVSLSIYINCTENTYFEDVPTYRVVLTSSMEKKNKDNEYLFENNLDNQISAFDLIATYKLPNEEDLQLYDIVVYEVDGILVVHRIVGIEEPNESHPNERHFLLQGDAVGSPDRFPVLYSQMKGIYKGFKIPFIGSLILFMKSFAGWLCIALVCFALVITPIIDKKLLLSRKERYDYLLELQNENNPFIDYSRRRARKNHDQIC